MVQKGHTFMQYRNVEIKGTDSPRKERGIKRKRWSEGGKRKSRCNGIILTEV
jgi:hypothetical protein